MSSAAKRPRGYESPTESFIIQQSKKIDVCGHCNEKCVAESKAILCDFCHSWTHTSCEGLKDDQYNKLTQLTSRVENISYYCNLNQCAVAHKKLLYECLCKVTQSEDVPSIRSLIAEQDNLHRIISEVSTKIDTLHSQNVTLQGQLQSTSETFTKVSNTKPLATPEPPALSANSIADELADRKQREANVVVYNLPELPDKSSDRSQFTDLCNTVFGIKVKIVKSLRLGKRQDSKPRPFLITMESIQDKEIVTSNSYILRRHELYQTAFVSPDMTKYQRSKHKQLVEELKRRRVNQPNLVIRDGVIVTRTARPSQATNQMDTSIATPVGATTNSS